MKKILFVPGIYNFDFYQYFWKKECEKLGFEFLEFDKTFYTYWDFEKMRRIIRDGRKIVRENKKLIIICHSFGGILINCILSGMKKYEVSKIVIIESPLDSEGMGMGYRKNILSYDRSLKYNCDVISFGGYVDEMVPFWLTRYKFGKHYNILADHMSALLFPWTVRKILRLAKV